MKGKKLAATLLLAASLTGTLAATALAEEKTVSIGIVSAWESLCPYFSTGNYTDIIADQIYDRLFVSNLDGSVEPRLAYDYSMPEDKSTITFYLNEDATWQDGEPVTADDVVYTAQVLADPGFNSKKGNTNYFAGTDESGKSTEEGIQVVADDAHTVTFTLKEPMNELPILTLFNRYFYIIPKHIFETKSIDELNDVQTWIDNYIGSGPFIYDSYVDGQSIEFTKNENYYLGAADIDRLVIKVVEGSQMLASLITGDIDVISGGGIGSVPLSDWGAAQATDGIETYSGRTYAYQAMIFNTTGPRTSDPLIRQGLNIAINRQVIVDALIEGEAASLYGPYPDYHPYYAADLDWPEYDPEKAKALLEEAGFDFDTPLELIVPTGNEIRIQSTVLIQQDLEAIGVKTNITQYDFSTLMAKMRDGDFDLGMCGSAGSIAPNEPLGWLDNNGGANFTCIKDTRYVDAFNAATYLLDDEEQKAAFADIQQTIIEDSPIAYLYSQNSLMAYSSRLSGLDPDKFGQVNWAVWEWTVE